jgi:hypothetical protein
MTENLSFEELPEFKSYLSKLFGEQREFPVYEIARLIYKQNHGTMPSHRLEEVVYVIGRSVNQGSVSDKNYTLFCATSAKTEIGKAPVAINSSGKGVRASDLESYQILKPHDKSSKWDVHARKMQRSL